MTVKEVLTRQDRKAFLEVPRILYRNDDTWVRPLDKEIESIFDPDKNVYFAHGEASRWLLYDESRQPIGRVAAFIDHNTCDKYDQCTGGMGFFECIHKQEAANLLFDTARDWLKERGMEAMDGPINFGETDKYWGLLVDGFTHPSYEIAYNHPYYQELFENYGFKTYFKQEGFHLDVTGPLPPRFERIAQRVVSNPDYTFEHFRWKEADRHIQDFVSVFNVAWESFKENFQPLEVSYIKKTLKKARAIIDEEFIWIAYARGRPIAIYLMYPDVNLILKQLKGRLNLPAMLKFLYLKKRKTMTRARGVLMGVIPDYQNRGIEAGIIHNLVRVFERKSHYTEIEFSWVGDFNPKMRKIFISVGCKSVKHYITYRYLFDRDAKFRRYPIPGEDEIK